MLSLRARRYRSLRLLALRPAPELNSWRSIPCAHSVPAPLSRLGNANRTLVTSTEKTPKRASYIPSSYKLRTLRPERLTIVGQEVLNLSGKTSPSVPTAIDGHLVRCFYDRSHLKGREMTTPYPPNTRGFFYYHNPTDGPALSAGVRFRLCDSADAFERGRDLLDPRGDAWGPKNVELVKQEERKGFLALLRAERLIDEALVDEITGSELTHYVGRSLYSLFDPFYLDVAQSKQRLRVVARAKRIVLRLSRHMFEDRSNYSSIMPLTGTIKVQFELSDLPAHAKLGPTLVIRVLAIATPITVDPNYRGHVVPVPLPGTLLQRLSRRAHPVVCLPLRRQRMAAALLELDELKAAVRARAITRR